MTDRTRVALVCEECGARNYKVAPKSKKGEPAERLTLKKFCRHCGRHTVHRESK